MYISSNLTPEEALRLHGRVSDEQMNELLETHAAYEYVTGAAAHIEEARGGYVDEDFLNGPLRSLEEHMRGLHVLLKKVRGENKEQVQQLIDSLKETIIAIEGEKDEMVRSGEYSLEELEKARKILG